MDLLKKSLLASFAVLAPIQMVLVTVGVLVLVDLITGIWAAIKKSQRVSSAAMRRTVSKMLIYQIAVITGYLLGHYILDDIIPIAKIVAGVIGMVEFKSILENSSIIVGEDIVSLIMSKLGSNNDNAEKPLPKKKKPTKKR